MGAMYLPGGGGAITHTNTMPFSGDGSDAAHDPSAWYNSEKPQSDNRIGYQAAHCKIDIFFFYELVETLCALMKLGADPTYQEVTVGGHLSQNDSGSVLDPSIGLGERYQNDVAPVHG